MQQLTEQDNLYINKNKRYVDGLFDRLSAISTAELTLDEHISKRNMSWFEEHDHEAMTFNRERFKTALHRTRISFKGKITSA